MPEKSISYPKVCKRYDDLYYVDFRLSNKRYRLFSGSKIGSSLSPNTYPLKLRRAKAIELADEVYRYLISNNYSFNKKLDNVGLFDYLIQKKLSEPLSKSYHKCLNSIAIKLRNELLSKGNISVDFIDSISLRNNNNTSYNTTRRHVNVLINYLFDNGFNINKSKLKNRKQKEALHKSIINVKDLLEDIKIFNYNLYLCALLTYGCLLRPHTSRYKHDQPRSCSWSNNGCGCGLRVYKICSPQCHGPGLCLYGGPSQPIIQHRLNITRSLVAHFHFQILSLILFQFIITNAYR